MSYSAIIWSSFFYYTNVATSASQTENGLVPICSSAKSLGSFNWLSAQLELARSEVVSHGTYHIGEGVILSYMLVPSHCATLPFMRILTA